MKKRYFVGGLRFFVAHNILVLVTPILAAKPFFQGNAQRYKKSNIFKMNLLEFEFYLLNSPKLMFYNVYIPVSSGIKVSLKIFLLSSSKREILLESYEGFK